MYTQGNSANPHTNWLATVLFSLYFAQGLPTGIISQALPALLREQGVSRSMIGLFGLVLIPWSLKFVWAPWVDKHYLPNWGPSRSWIIPLQLGAACCFAILALLQPALWVTPLYLWLLFATLLVLSMVAATQDIATDSLAVRLLRGGKRTLGNAFQVAGARMGYIVGGSLLLVLSTYLSWATMCIALAGIVLLALLPVLQVQEPPSTQTHQPSKKTDFKTHWQHFTSNRVIKRWVLVLLTIKAGEQLASPMVKPMLVDMGYSLGTIGWYASFAGSLATIIGAGIAYLALKRKAIVPMLVLFTLLQALGNGLYAFCATLLAAGASQWYHLGFVANFIEHMPTGMLMVAVFNIMMDYCRVQYAGTDFTIQAALLSVLAGLCHLASGVIADLVGYTTLFSVSTVAAALSLCAIYYWQQALKNNPGARSASEQAH